MKTNYLAGKIFIVILIITTILLVMDVIDYNTDFLITSVSTIFVIFLHIWLNRLTKKTIVILSFHHNFKIITA